MPRVSLGDAQKRAYMVIDYRKRVTHIIDAAMNIHGMSREQLANASGISYQTLNGRMRWSSEFRVSELKAVADALRLDATTRAALMGCKEKCRYEAGYQGG